MLEFLGVLFSSLATAALAWGWLLLLFLAMWIAWETYRLLKNIDFVGSMQWVFLQITVPEDSPYTPKAFENAIEVWGGIHKNPDVIEKLFDGYMLSWYSCEIHCTKDRARYIMVVPAQHRKFFEGAIYGQYPNATITEVEDYTQRFQYDKLEEDFDLFGTDVILTKDDFYPVKTFHDYEDSFAEDDKYIDPHQALVEAFTNVEEGEEFWYQILIKPIGGKDVEAWSEKGQERIAEINGEEVTKEQGWMAKIGSVLAALPQLILTTALFGPQEGDSASDNGKDFKFSNPSEDAEMKGILQKISRTGFRTKIRVVHVSNGPKMHKANVAKAFGVFKQFNTFNLNGFRPDPDTKTNAADYILKYMRRKYRKRVMLFLYQWRDFWGDESGDMMTAEELATLYHFPVKYVRTPALERAQSGTGSPPSNLPYI